MQRVLRGGAAAKGSLSLRLINWLWLEELLVDACETEIRRFGAEHPDEPVYAFCLEYDGLAGTLGLSYGTRRDVERELARQAAELGEHTCYRASELRPDGWRYRNEGVADREGYWERASRVLAVYREAIDNSEEDPEAAEFLWLRLEYLAECVVRQLKERDAFAPLRRDEEFLAYTATDCESLEELEDRLSRLYPHYRRATIEWAEHARIGSVRSRRCQGDPAHRQPNPDGLARCTVCNTWLCRECQGTHEHPELAERQSFFRGEEPLF